MIDGGTIIAAVSGAIGLSSGAEVRSQCNVVAAITANAAFGDGTLPTLKLNGSVTISVLW